jgi:hypothetical protein
MTVRGTRTTRSQAAGRRTPTAAGTPQGGNGGAGSTATNRAGMMAGQVGGVTMYLWVLVGIEVLLMGYLRSTFRRDHGG